MTQALPGIAKMQIYTAPPGATLPPAMQEKIAASAKQFEAIFFNDLVTTLFNTVDSSKGLFGGGEGEQAWKPMMVSELAKQISAHGGLGIARPVMDQMLRIQEKAK